MNVILINCDDLGYGDLGCYGSTVNATPALDRLAAEGVRFTDFYMASSVCSPSRAAMLTGCYPPRISLNRVLFPGEAEGLNPAETSLAQVLKNGGFDTTIIGKWHCGDQPAFLPRQFGFDAYFGLPYSNDMGRQAGPEPTWAPHGTPPLPLLRDDAVAEEQPDQVTLTDRYLAEARAFLRNHAGAGRRASVPFFLYLAHMFVHLPIYVPERFLQKSVNGRYGAAVACVDWVWDELDAELRRLGLADDTLVIFTSDNGSRAGGEGGSNAPLKGRKFTTWEGGFRLPCIMRWPGRIRPGGVSREIFSSLDFLPTLAALAGVPAKTAGKIDGLDLSGLVLGRPDSRRRQEFAYYSGNNLAAFRQGRWKLHMSRKGEKWNDPFLPVAELYDLETDPGEEQNVAAAHPEVVRRLRGAAAPLATALGDAANGIAGAEVRPCGRVANPRCLTEYDPNHPYAVAEYDLADRG